MLFLFVKSWENNDVTMPPLLCLHLVQRRYFVCTGICLQKFHSDSVWIVCLDNITMNDMWHNVLNTSNIKYNYVLQLRSISGFTENNPQMSANVCKCFANIRKSLRTIRKQLWLTANVRECLQKSGNICEYSVNDPQVVHEWSAKVREYPWTNRDLWNAFIQFWYQQ